MGPPHALEGPEIRATPVARLPASFSAEEIGREGLPAEAQGVARGEGPAEGQAGPADGPAGPFVEARRPRGAEA